MRATITLGGKGTYDNDALESIDSLCEVLSKVFKGINFSMRSSFEIDCEFESVTHTEYYLLECVLNRGSCPVEIERFMRRKNLRFEMIAFETDWEND